MEIKLKFYPSLFEPHCYFAELPRSVTSLLDTGVPFRYDHLQVIKEDNEWRMYGFSAPIATRYGPIRRAKTRRALNKLVIEHVERIEPPEDLQTQLECN